MPSLENEGKSEHEEPASTNTKKRLESILGSFKDFDSDMKFGTRQRRERDEQRIAQLTTELTRLEKTLSTEIARRIEMNKSLQQWAEAEVKEVNDHFGGLIETRSGAIQDRLDGIAARIDRLKDHFDVEMAKIPLDMERRGAELTRMLTDFEAAFEAERASRLEREARIVKQLADHEHRAAEEFDTERAAREAAYADLRRTLDDSVRSRIKGDERFQAAVREELAALRNAVAAERETREREDDEIVDALNRYTTKLQTSLRILNSSET
ncbi:unnamed protein product [Phaeothamnion confervicola]